MKATAEPKRFALGASEDCRRVAVDGVSIAYDDRGAGFPVVGLHAITHGSRDFEHVAAPLARRWRFITPDWPGQGRSGADKYPARLARYTEILAGFIDALKLDRVVLIGNSIGGSAAMAYAADFPERVAGLILANPGGLIPMNALGRRVCGMMAALGVPGIATRSTSGRSSRCCIDGFCKRPRRGRSASGLSMRRRNAPQSGRMRG